MKPSVHYEVVVEPNRSWFRIPWHELAEYRDLLFLMVHRDFVGKYKQTILGPVWFVVQPLMTTLVFTVVFGKWARLPTDGQPSMLFYLAGTVAWGYFAQCFTATSTTFVSNASLFGKVYFPRLIVPLSKTLSSLLGFAIQFTTFMAFWIYFKAFTPAGAGIHPHPAVAAVPLLLVESAAMGLGAGLWMSALTAKYRDLGFLSGFLTQLWMYASLVVIPMSQVPEKWRWLLAFNPMAVVVESFRFMFFGTGTVYAAHAVLAAVLAVLLLASGVLVFSRTERTFIDTV